MKVEVSRKWVAALRSGHWTQGTHALKTEKSDGTMEHCCLGVLCELAKADGVVLEEEKRGGMFEFDGSRIWVPEVVRDWAGMRSNTGEFGSAEGEESLMNLNDSGWLFEGIANVIEAKWEVL